MNRGNRIWPSLPPASKNPSLRAAFGVAIQGNMDPCFGVWPWIATSQALLAMRKEKIQLFCAINGAVLTFVSEFILNNKPDSEQSKLNLQPGIYK